MISQNRQVQAASGIVVLLVAAEIRILNEYRPAMIWPPAKEELNSPQVAWTHLSNELEDLHTLQAVDEARPMRHGSTQRLADATADMLVTLASCKAAIEDRLPAHTPSTKSVKGNCSLCFKEETALRHFNQLAREVVDTFNRPVRPSSTHADVGR
jgi:hypothetical protein